MVPYKTRGLFALALFGADVSAQTVVPLPDSVLQFAKPVTPVSAPAMKNYPRLPLAFVKHGQGSEERFVARGEGYVIALDGGKAIIDAGTRDSSHAISLDFAGARPGLTATAGEELPGKINDYRGSDPKKWRVGVPTYARVTYPEVYPGIDVVYYGSQQQLEFDLVVKPGADPDAIRLKVAGADRLSLDPSGALKIDGFQLVMPRIYQEIDGARKTIGGRFKIVGRDQVALTLDRWDRTRSLVIDPTIVYSTLFGGGLGSNSASGIGLDPAGNIVIAGYTSLRDTLPRPIFRRPTPIRIT